MEIIAQEMTSLANENQKLISLTLLLLDSTDNDREDEVKTLGGKGSSINDVTLTKTKSVLGLFMVRYFN
jgi:hypothetical protein